MDKIDKDCFLLMVNYLIEFCYTKEEAWFELSNLVLTNKSIYNIIKSRFSFITREVPFVKDYFNNEIFTRSFRDDDQFLYSNQETFYQNNYILLKSDDIKNNILCRKIPQIDKKRIGLFHNNSYLVILYYYPFCTDKEYYLERVLYYNSKGFKEKDILNLIYKFYFEKLNDTIKSNIISSIPKNDTAVLGVLKNKPDPVHCWYFHKQEDFIKDLENNTLNTRKLYLKMISINLSYNNDYIEVFLNHDQQICKNEQDKNKLCNLNYYKPL